MAVNVIIPIHNTEPYLFNRALSSLATQTKRNFITTVVNDASSMENSIEYKKIIDKFNFGILYIEISENVGPGQARQRAMDDAPQNIDYFMFLDADDILMPTAIDILYSEARVNNAEIVVSNIYTEGKHRSENFIIPFGNNTTWMHGKIYERVFLEKYGIRFLNEKIYNEDSYFNLVAIRLSERRFYINEALYIWSYNKNSITRINGKEDFLNTYGIDYLKCQIKAVGDILKHRKEENFGSIFGMIYNASQRELLVNENNAAVKKLLNELFQYENIKKNLFKKDFIDSFLEKAKAGQEGRYFKQSALEWLTQYGGAADE